MLSANWRDRLRTQRVLLLLAYDVTAWALALMIFALVRVDFRLSALSAAPSLLLIVACCSLQAILGWVLRLYHGRARLASLEELLLLSWVVATVGGSAFLVNAVAYPDGVPRSIPLGAMLLALAFMGWGRAVWRRGKEASGLVINNQAEPVLVFGAGDAGTQLVKSMLRDPSSPWRPVALLDDDRWKQHLRIEGIQVFGTRDKVAVAAERTGAALLIIAIPSATAELVRDVSELARGAGLGVKVLPALTELMEQRVGLSDIRDIDVTDVLGRRQIETDLESIAGYLTGKRVLVTGAGGSIGSELCRQIHRWGPEELIMLDRDESALHTVQLSIHGRALLDGDDVVLGDIRDTLFMHDLLARRRPHVLFHAAALKHLPMLEQYPGEAVKTNMWGTLSVLEAAQAAGVEKFINVSTDKAANPTSMLGYSKRIAERLTAAMSSQADGTFVSVRFGNVLGSRGSVLTSFASQIVAGGPVTVTHPEVTRFFMTVQEAVQLVIQAAAIGRDGEALVLDMGKPVRIEDVARQLIEQSGARVQIHYTGLRDGEKLHEELFGAGEVPRRTAHPSISHVHVPAMDPVSVRALDPWDSRQQLAGTVAQLCEQGAVDGMVASDIGAWKE